MYTIRQTELFSFDQLLKMKPDDRYSQIFVHLDLGPLLRLLGKKSHRGRPEELNVRAMINSLLIGKMERMEFVKDIVRRLRFSEEFRLQCRFTGSDRTPSEASYSRLIHEVLRLGIIETAQDELVLGAISEGFLSGNHLAVDSSAIEAWDCQYPEQASKRAAHRRKSKSPKPPEEQLQLNIDEEAEVELKPEPEMKPKRRRGRPSREESEQLKIEREAHEATLGPFEKKIADMMPYSYEELLEAMPRHASFCSKKNSKGKVESWYGYKANVIVDTDSQYMVSGVLSSAHPNDQRMAIVLLKGLQLKFPMLQVKHVLADKGYDCTTIYQLVRSLGAYPVIDIIHHTEPPEGFDEDFKPVCKQGHSYRYDSFDPKYNTLKFTKPKECNNCPMAESGCQKVHKIKIEQDLRKYTYPARGSESFIELYKKRTAVERVFAYLKEYFGLKRTRHRGLRATVDFQLSSLAYNLCKFSLDKLNKRIEKSTEAA